MDAVLDRLLSQAYLFDDPGAYEAGVRDALEAATARSEKGRIADSMREHPSTGVSRRLRSAEHSAA